MRPMSDHVIVQLEEVEKRTEGGLHLPDTHRSNEGFQRAVVVAVGPGRWGMECERLPMTIRKGDKVLVAWGGHDFELSKVKYRVLREDEVLAVMD